MWSNVVILGAPRSGTSLLAGTFHHSGYYLGDKLWQPSKNNPTGVFEDMAVNQLNEKILTPALPLPDQPLPSRNYLWRWLGILPPTLYRPLSFDQVQWILARKKRCIKDPRFSYTLNAWLPHLRDAVIVCIFRNPAAVVNSLIKECEKIGLNWGIDKEYGIGLWLAMYRSILWQHDLSCRNPFQNRWVFVNHESVINGDGLGEIEAALDGRKLVRDFIDPKLNRQSSLLDVPEQCQSLYAQLNSLASLRSEATRRRSILKPKLIVSSAKESDTIRNATPTRVLKPAVSEKSNQPVLLLSVPNSGESTIEKLLSVHPEIDFRRTDLSANWQDIVTEHFAKTRATTPVLSLHHSKGGLNCVELSDLLHDDVRIVSTSCTNLLNQYLLGESKTSEPIELNIERATERIFWLLSYQSRIMKVARGRAHLQLNAETVGEERELLESLASFIGIGPWPVRASKDCLVLPDFIAANSKISNIKNYFDLLESPLAKFVTMVQREKWKIQQHTLKRKAA